MFGVLNMLLKFVKEYGPKQRIAVVFDASGKTFRDELFTEYKANRPPMPNDLRSQVEPLLAIIRAQGLPLLRVEGVEADDVIGTLACRAAKTGQQVLISTGDKDMAQLVNEAITLINTMSNSKLDRAGVKAKFDVYPEQIIDYLALVGDSSDNIPGIEKVGPKTAAKWLNQYGTLDALIEHVGDISGKVGENLRAGLETLALSRKLATIRTDCELDQTVEQLVPGEPDVAGLRELYTRYELRTLLRQLDVSSPAAAPATSDAFALSSGSGSVSGASTEGSSRTKAGSIGKGSHVAESAEVSAERLGEADAPPGSAGVGLIAGGAVIPHALTAAEKRYETVTEWAQLERWLEALRSAELFSFDTETTSLDYMKAEIVGVSFATEPGVAAYVPVAHNYPGAPDQLSRDKVLAALKPLLEDPERAKVGHHLKYDAHVLLSYGIRLAGMRYDSMLESYVWKQRRDPTRHGQCVRAVSRSQNDQVLEEVAAARAPQKQLTFNQVPVDKASEYSSEDADITLRLHKALWPQLQTVPALVKLYEEIGAAAGARVAARGTDRRTRRSRAVEDTEPRDKCPAQLQELVATAHKEAAAGNTTSGFGRSSCGATDPVWRSRRFR